MNDDEMIQDFRRHGQELRELNRVNRQRLAFTFFGSCLLVASFWLLVHPWDWYLAAIVLAWITLGVIMMTWPGHCVVCDSWTGFGGPRAGAKHRAWWDLRAPSRKDMVFVCPQHAPLYLLAMLKPQDLS